ncbi:MAG: HAD-IA family hydrolase [Coriobacteriales bacterium]|jgi:pyrophosphatase PpaX|nr:HAD-IA family hydrolase [Coriobacteriales bacterium]
MTEKKAILFDLDGTLLDTKELILASFRYATREVLGEQLPDEVILPYIGIPLIYQMQAIAAEHADRLLEVYREHNARTHDELIRYFEGTREMLNELSAEGRRLAVVTSKRNESALHGLAHFDLLEYFEFVIGSDDTAVHKPEPEPLLLAAKRLGLAPDTCIYVGDSPFDMQAARAAGILAVAALWGMFSREQLWEAGAQYEATTPAALPAVIRESEKGA